MKEIESHKIANATEILEFFAEIKRGEIKEEVAISSPEGVEVVKLPTNIKGRLVVAAKEILKCYPNSYELLQVQLAKAKSDTQKAEADVRVAKYETEQLENNIYVNPEIVALSNLLKEIMKKEDDITNETNSC